MVQNCGTPYQLTLSTLKIYITLRKILLNGAYRVNVMGLLYNDKHDILPPIWNISHYFIGFICVSVSIYNSHITVHTIFSCYYSILFTSLGHILFFRIWTFISERYDNIFLPIPCFYNNFGDMNTVCQLCCFNRYLYVIHLCVFHFSECLCVCVCVPVYILLCMYELYVYIYSRTIAVPANVYCWIWPDFK